MSQPLLDLVIMRHGEAESIASSDERRSLTESGRLMIARQARILKEQGFEPTEIVHSPYLRTDQTAAICHSRFPSATCRSDAALLHSAEPDRIPFMWSETPSMLLVSHMPLVGRLIQYLCPESGIYGLPVGGYVRIAVNMTDLSSTLIFDGSGH